MRCRHIVIRDSKEVEVKDLSEEEQVWFREELNRKAAESIGYIEDKTA